MGLGERALSLRGFLLSLVLLSLSLLLFSSFSSPDSAWALALLCLDLSGTCFCHSAPSERIYPEVLLS